MDQQRASMGGHSHNSSFSFPLFPPGMSEEDIHEFMQDPENQGKIKVIDHGMISRLYIYMSIYIFIYLIYVILKSVIDSVMQSLSQQISEEASSFFNPFGGKGPSNVEVKVHMVGMPGKPSGLSGLFHPAGVKPESSTPNAATVSGDKNGNSKKTSRLPGSFFKGELFIFIKR